MEIALIILAFLFGLAVGAVLMAGYIRYKMLKQAEAIQEMVSASNGDPMELLTGLFDQLSEGKKNA